ncbi:hypothetical protein [Teredinibacter purpureus]|uniref:hypothetical protein n=1 Tax=Teredinibacter purpureus TaxID=2731756 RepID=UPI0013C47DE1|nr:hypothetical protein [Teredinibacter purpureus]
MKIQLTEEESAKVYEILGEPFFEQLRRSEQRSRIMRYSSMVIAPLVIALSLYLLLAR